MSRAPKRGTFVVSFDLESRSTYLPTTPGQRDHLAADLLSLAAQFGLPATWAFDDLSAGAAQRVAEGEAQELAVWGSPAWCGPQCGRGPFVRGLKKRLRQSDRDVTTLVLPAGNIAQTELAVKYGLTAFSTRPPAQASVAPQTVRYGLWELPGTVTLLPQRTWLPGGTSRHVAKIRKAVELAQFERSVVHLVVSIETLIDRRRQGMSVLSKLLAFASRLRKQGGLDLCTVAEVTRRRQLSPVSRPQARSILRAA